MLSFFAREVQKKVGSPSFLNFEYDAFSEQKNYDQKTSEKKSLGRSSVNLNEKFKRILLGYTRRCCRRSATLPTAKTDFVSSNCDEDQLLHHPWCFTKQNPWLVTNLRLQLSFFFHPKNHVKVCLELTADICFNFSNFSLSCSTASKSLCWHVVVWLWLRTSLKFSHPCWVFYSIFSSDNQIC